MKEKILALLQTKFEGADAKTLSRIADNLAKTTQSEADIQTAVDGVTIMQVMESYGDARATDATRTAVMNYEKKYGLKEGKPISPAEPPKTTPPAEPPKTTPPAEPQPSDEPEYIKAMRKQMEEMQKRLDEADKAKIAKSRKDKLNAYLKDAPDAVKTMYSTSFDAMQFQDDEAFNTWLEESKQNIETLIASLKAKGAVTTPPRAGGQGGGQPNPLVAARAERAAKVKPSAIVGAPTPKAAE